MSLEEKQKQRIFLRERFLRMLTSLLNTPAEFTLYDQSQVQAKFRCTDIEVQNFLVDDLQTPLGIHPSSLIRSADVLSVKLTLPEGSTSSTKNDET